SRFSEIRESLQLNQPNRSHDVAHVITPTLFDHIKLPASLSAISHIRITHDPQQASVLGLPENLPILGDDATAFPGGDVLDTVEAETGDVADGTDPLSIPFRTEGVGRIFDDAQ